MKPLIFISLFRNYSPGVAIAGLVLGRARSLNAPRRPRRGRPTKHTIWTASFCDTGRVVTLLLLLPALAGGQEVFNCNGLWTNKPCEGQVLGSFAEKPHTPLTREQQEESRKRRLIHELELKQFNARQIVDKSEVVREAVDQCLEPLTTWEDCRRRLLEADGWLDRQIEAARRLAEEERKDQEANETPGGAVTIINIQPERRDWGWSHYRRPKSPSRDRDHGGRVDTGRESRPVAEESAAAGPKRSVIRGAVRGGGVPSPAID